MPDAACPDGFCARSRSGDETFGADGGRSEVTLQAFDLVDDSDDDQVEPGEGKELVDGEV